MAHPPDRALSRAITEVLREARARGMSTRDIATFFGVADPTISRWETGARLPALDLLPRFDELARQPRGYVLRRASYVADTNDDVIQTRFDVNFDDADERDLWKLDHIPEPRRWKLILELRKINAEPPPPRKRQQRPAKARARKAG